MTQQVIQYKTVTVKRSYNRWIRCIALIGIIIGFETMFVLLTSAYLYQTNRARIIGGKETNNVSESQISPEEFIRDFERNCENVTTITATPVDGGLYLCPCVSPDLLGWKPIVSVNNPPHFGEMELEHTELQPGGAWEPPGCKARHQVAIIVPFRDRETHLRIFLSVMHPILQRQRLNYRIFVIEQSAPRVFNKAAMMNIGFMEAKKLGDFDCFIFHDVDMLAEDDRNLYVCSDQPRHVGSHVDKFKYQVPYDEIFGGATAFTAEQFQRANGFSNVFYGWGGEDDDMYNRVVAAGMQIIRYPGSVAKYHMVKHKADNRNPWNKHSYVAWKIRPKVYKVDGLNSLRYKLKMYEYRPLYTWIYAEIPEPSQVKLPYLDESLDEPSDCAICRSSQMSVLIMSVLIALYSTAYS